MGSWHMFLPSEVFASIYHYDQRLFRERFLGPPGVIEAFWNHQKNTTWFMNHPVLSDPATDLGKCVPLVFHQDDGEAHRRRSFMVTTFGSAVIHGSPWEMKRRWQKHSM